MLLISFWQKCVYIVSFEWFPMKWQDLERRRQHTESFFSPHIANTARQRRGRSSTTIRKKSVRFSLLSNNHKVSCCRRQSSQRSVVLYVSTIEIVFHTRRRRRALSKSGWTKNVFFSSSWELNIYVVKFTVRSTPKEPFIFWCLGNISLMLELNSSPLCYLFFRQKNRGLVVEFDEPSLFSSSNISLLFSSPLPNRPIHEWCEFNTHTA